MMYNSFRLIYLLLTITLASQGVFYWLGVHKAFASISIDAFAEQRKAVDVAIAGNLKFLYLTVTALGLLLLITCWKKYASFDYVAVAIAFLLLLGDLLLAMKENIPINQLFHHYSSTNNSVDWITLRSQWLSIICIRGVLAISAMLVLLASWVWPRFTSAN